MPFVSYPASTRLSCQTLRMRSAAPTSRTSAEAVCTATSASRARLLRPTTPRPACWRLPSREPDRRKAGSRPNAHAARIEMPAVKSKAGRSRCAAASPGIGAPAKPPATASGAARTRSGTPTHAMTAPTAPPAAARRSASVTCGRTRSPRAAPSARRTDSSTRRFSALTVNRFATLTHAMRKTMPTVPSRIQSAVDILPTSCSRSGFTTGR